MSLGGNKMKFLKRVVCMVLLFSITFGLVSSTDSLAKKKKKVKDVCPYSIIGTDYILYNIGEGSISVYNSDYSNHKEVATLNSKQAIRLLPQQEEDSEYYKVYIEGKALGVCYIEKSDNLISGKVLKKYVEDHYKDFTLNYTVDDIHGLYADKALMKADRLDYSSYIVEYDDEYDTYKTDSKKETVDSGKQIYYAKVNKKRAYIKSKKGAILFQPKKNETFEIAKVYNKRYKIKLEDGFGYIARKVCKVSVKKIKVNNEADNNMKKSRLYPILEETDKMVRVVINNKAYYVPKESVEREYIPTEKCYAVEVNEGRTYDVTKVGAGFLRVQVYNGDSDEKGIELYTPYDNRDTTFGVTFDWADVIEDEEGTATNSTNTDDSLIYKDVELPDNTPTTPLRDAIVSYGMQFLGKPYVYGGTDPLHGIDCSGFQQYLLQHFGFEISRSTATQIYDASGRDIKPEDIQRGDLIYYTRDGVHPYHVVMYIGNGQCLHASCPSLGICIGTVRTDRILKIKNYID